MAADVVVSRELEPLQDERLVSRNERVATSAAKASVLRYERRLRSATRWLLVLLLLAAAGCALNPKPAVCEWSGFLHDYSRLQLGEPGDLPFVYRNPKAQWTSYDKVLIEPIALWRSGEHSLDPIPEDDLLLLVAHFERAVRARLGSALMLVDEAQPGTLRLRLAITEASASDPVIDMRTVTPEHEAYIRGTGPLGKELAAFIDAAVIEGEIRDAVTGELLAQGIDRRGASLEFLEGRTLPGAAALE